MFYLNEYKQSAVSNENENVVKVEYNLEENVEENFVNELNYPSLRSQISSKSHIQTAN